MSLMDEDLDLTCGEIDLVRTLVCIDDRIKAAKYFQFISMTIDDTKLISSRIAVILLVLILKLFDS